MSVKRFTRVTCAAGILLAELAPTAAAQPLDSPDDIDQDAVPVGSDQHPKKLAYDSTNSASQAATPERVTVVESAAIADRPSADLGDGRSIAAAPPPIAQPERLTSMPVAVRPTPLSAPTRDVAVSTRAQDLGTPQAVALPISRPEVMVEESRSSRSQTVAGRSGAVLATGTDQTSGAATQSLPTVGVQSATVSSLSASRRATPEPAARLVSQGAPPASANAIAPIAAPVAPQSAQLAGTVPIATTAATAPNTAAIAQAPAPSTPTPAPISPKVGATFTSGPGVGYTSSFTAVKGFVPITQQPGRNITFAEGQAFLDTGNGNPGANLVLGHRFYDSNSDRIYGGYVAFDHRNTGRNGFNQVGLGVETLGKSWDARINGYLPIGDTRQLVSENINTSITQSDPFFRGNFLAANRTIQQQIHRRFEAAAAGLDVEAGGKITALGQEGELRGYGGMYYFGAPGGEGTVGFRTRLEARPNENLQLGVALSRDNNYGTTVALSVGVLFPTNRSPVNRDRPANPLLARLGDPVTRNANIVLDRQVENRQTTTQELALINNPATGQPWQFRHAVPGVGSGDGTFENPTGTLAEALAVAQPDDIVYVQPGTNPGIPAFTIPDRVQVLSTGPVQRIDTIELGNIPLPLSGAGQLPAVQGTVTMGNSTTLSGFAISTATGPGILANNITQATIRDNAIANTAAEGIALNNAFGAITITDNTIQGAQAEGVALSNNQGQVDLLLARNQITNNGAASVEGDGVSLELTNNATGNFTLANNAIANNSGTGVLADGVDIQLFDATTGTFNLTDNTITGNQANGVDIALESTAQGTFNLSRNTLSNNQEQGASIITSDNAQAQTNLDGNTIASNQQNGILAIANNQSSNNLNITNNTIASNQGDGILLQTVEQARMVTNLTGNTITNNSSSGVSTTAVTNSQMRFLAEANTITNNGFAGLSIASLDNATILAGLRANNLTGNLTQDLDALTFNAGSRVCLQAQNNTIGSLTLDDTSFLGQIQVEDGAALATNNTITTPNLGAWSGTSVPAGTCGL